MINCNLVIGFSNYSGKKLVMVNGVLVTFFFAIINGKHTALQPTSDIRFF